MGPNFGWYESRNASVAPGHVIAFGSTLPDSSCAMALTASAFAAFSAFCWGLEMMRTSSPASDVPPATGCCHVVTAIVWVAFLVSPFSHAGGAATVTAPRSVLVQPDGVDAGLISWSSGTSSPDPQAVRRRTTIAIDDESDGHACHLLTVEDVRDRSATRPRETIAHSTRSTRMATGVTSENRRPMKE